MTTLSRRHLLAGSGALVLASAGVSEPRDHTKETPRYSAGHPDSAPDLDPAVPDLIYAAIARTREAWGDLCRACDASDRAQLTYGLESLQYELADAAQGEVTTRYGEVLDEFLGVVPTTLSGVVAYIDFLGDVAAFRDVAIESWQQEIITASLKAAVLRHVELPTSAALTSHPTWEA